MMTGEVAELKEESGVSENRGENNINPEKNDALEFVRNIQDVEQEERPCSLSSQKDRLSLASSRSSNTPDPGHIEGSLACTSKRRNSIKRSKRYLPPDEPNEVSGILADVDAPDSPGLLRNMLLTVAVNEVEKERKLLKDSETPESLLLDGMSSSCSSSVRDGNYGECFDKGGTSTSQNTEKSTPVNYRRSTSASQKDNSSLDEKSTKSETFLLDGNYQRVLNSYVKRPKSAPVEVTTRCTQTEWSWLEDMKRFEILKTQLQPSSTRHLDSVDREGKLHVKHQTQQSRTQSIALTNERKENIKREDSEDDLFKEPTEEFSSSSSDEEDLMVEFDKETFLPSIGPPKILQYVKESVNPPLQNDRPDKNQHDRTPQGSSEDHSCAFCKTEILERIEISQQISLSEKAKPSCPVYHEHIKQQSHYKEDDGFIKDELIDIQPHPPFGTKAARKEAKERAAERAREREMERQKVSGNAVNFYAMTRQMKTLTYSLASTKCMDDGWTVKPLTPVRAEGGEHLEPFDIEINSSKTQQKETFLERFYTKGERLLVLFPDGTGCCYYPSGNPAVIISSTEKGKYSYILQEDTYEHSRHYTGILGVFDPTGHGACYFERTGKIRMVLTPFGGTYFDVKGEKKKKWFWYNHHSNHVHAPPFQPITFAITKELSVRCMGQDYIIITYNHGRHTIRFNVGARLKAVAKKIKPPSTEENYELQLKEIRQFVNMIIERVQTTLRFPRSTRINKLPLTKPDRTQSKHSRLDSIFDKDDNATVVVN